MDSAVSNFLGINSSRIFQSDQILGQYHLLQGNF